MNAMGQLLRRLWVLLRHRRYDADLEEELRFHRTMKLEELEARGLDRHEANLETQRQLGNATLAREDARAVWIQPWIENAVRDVLYAFRGIRRDPGFAVVAVLTMALGIGANTAIFSVVNAVMLRPLRAPDAERLVRLVSIYGDLTNDVAYAPELKVWRQQDDVFEHVSSHRLEFFSLADSSGPEQIPVGRVTANFFDVFRARVEHGRVFTSDEDRPNGARVAMLSHELWVRRFGADAGAVGGRIALGGTPYLIVGIVAAGFDTEQLEPRPDVWVPFQDRFRQA